MNYDLINDYEYNDNTNKNFYEVIKYQNQVPW
jgi:hypothetical protein